MSTLAIATAREVFDLLRDDLVAIEQELGRDAASSVSTITEIAEYLREGGGKRIRPSLLLLSAHMLGFFGQGAIRLGTVVEMVHTATLVHDDIIDGADTRRGRPSANTTWGNEKCVLAGDWLYMQAFRVALPSRRSLATGLPRTSSVAVRSSTSSTIWKAKPTARPNVARLVSAASVAPASTAPRRIETENRQAVLRKMRS